jgi:dsDNA-specific endonuclease/ATPase MutS2
VWDDEVEELIQRKWGSSRRRPLGGNAEAGPSAASIVVPDSDEEDREEEEEEPPKKRRKVEKVKGKGRKKAETVEESEDEAVEWARAQLERDARDLANAEFKYMSSKARLERILMRRE